MTEVKLKTTDDYINRQVAIEALRYVQHKFTLADETNGMGTVKWDENIIYFSEAERVLMNLPSIQSQINYEDVINRQAAIDALMEKDKKLRNINWHDKPYAEDECRGIDEALSIISNLPSAQPEQEMGKWIRNDNGTYTCSICQSWIPEEQHFYAKYCLYCGKAMKR